MKVSTSWFAQRTQSTKTLNVSMDRLFVSQMKSNVLTSQVVGVHEALIDCLSEHQWLCSMQVFCCPRFPLLALQVSPLSHTHTSFHSTLHTSLCIQEQEQGRKNNEQEWMKRVLVIKKRIRLKISSWANHLKCKLSGFFLTSNLYCVFIPNL